MALHKEIHSKSGFTMAYWRLTSIELDNEQKTARLTVVPYVSAQARRAGLPPILNESRRYTVEDFDYAGTEYADRTILDYTAHFAPEAVERAGADIYKTAYVYLKNLPDFEGAEDI